MVYKHQFLAGKHIHIFFKISKLIYINENSEKIKIFMAVTFLFWMLLGDQLGQVGITLKIKSLNAYIRDE